MHKNHQVYRPLYIYCRPHPPIAGSFIATGQERHMFTPPPIPTTTPQPQSPTTRSPRSSAAVAGRCCNGVDTAMSPAPHSGKPRGRPDRKKRERSGDGTPQAIPAAVTPHAHIPFVPVHSLGGAPEFSYVGRHGRASARNVSSSSVLAAAETVLRMNTHDRRRPRTSTGCERRSRKKPPLSDAALVDATKGGDNNGWAKKKVAITDESLVSRPLLS